MKKRVIIIVIAVIVVTGLIVVLNLSSDNNSGGLFSPTRDTYGSDVTYRDDLRTEPIGTKLTYSLSHPKSAPYSIKTNSTGRFPLAYEADIEQGTAVVRIKDGDTIVKEYDIKVKENFAVELEPNHFYTIEVYIEKGKGTINLMWMEMAEDVASN